LCVDGLNINRKESQLIIIHLIITDGSTLYHRLSNEEVVLGCKSPHYMRVTIQLI